MQQFSNEIIQSCLKKRTLLSSWNEDETTLRAPQLFLQNIFVQSILLQLANYNQQFPFIKLLIYHSQQQKHDEIKMILAQIRLFFVFLKLISLIRTGYFIKINGKLVEFVNKKSDKNKKTKKGK